MKMKRKPSVIVIICIDPTNIKKMHDIKILMVKNKYTNKFTTIGGKIDCKGFGRSLFSKKDENIYSAGINEFIEETCINIQDMPDIINFDKIYYINKINKRIYCILYGIVKTEKIPDALMPYSKYETCERKWISYIDIMSDENIYNAFKATLQLVFNKFKEKFKSKE
jgi:hypothetical protein